LKKIFFLVFTVFITLNLTAAQIEDSKDLKSFVEKTEVSEEPKVVLLDPTPEIKAKIDSFILEIENIDEQLEDNILLKRYSNYIAYRSISKELHELKNELSDVNKKNRDLLYKVENKIRIKNNELELISEYKDSPIGKLINPPEIEKYEAITNPFGIINALSYKKKMKDHKKEFTNIIKDVTRLIGLLDKKILLYLDLYNLDPKDEYEKKINFLDSEKKDFNMVLEILTTTSEVYNRKIEQVILETDNQIADQISKTSIIFLIIAVVFIF